MSSVHNNLHLTLGFADSLEKNIIIEDVPQANVSNIKRNILAVNANDNGAYDALYQTFISNGGASFSKIVAAKLITVEEEVVYNG